MHDGQIMFHDVIIVQVPGEKQRNGMKAADYPGSDSP